MALKRGLFAAGVTLGAGFAYLLARRRHDRAPAEAPAAREMPDRALIRQCVRCGFCLPYCPTYRALGLEADSPRGRIYQMNLLSQGLIDPADPQLRLHIYRCLDCRACETACPSGVQYGRLLEATRSTIPPAGAAEAISRRVLLNGVLGSPRLLALAGAGARLYQRWGFQGLVRAGRGLRLAPFLQRMESMLPRLSGEVVPPPLPAFVPAVGERRCRVALLTGCVAAQFFPGTNRSTVAVLAANGCDVFIPPGQRCCGALQNHAGDRATALAMARHNIDVFEHTGADYVVTNAAGCGSMMKEYGELLRRDPAFAERARSFSERVRDVTELLADLPLRAPSKSLPLRVTYQDACHLLHGQKVREAPRRVLATIPGLQLVEMVESDWCCGSAGIYNITQPELSEKILAWKMANIAAVEPDVVLVANPGCLLQIEHGLRERGIPARAAHPVDLLAEAYGFMIGEACHGGQAGAGRTH